jgi:ribA/ribD-fused uncharacterized protein
MRKVGHLTLFHGADHPLSNWHPCRFHYEGATFSSVGQFMMFSKATMFEDEASAAAILAADRAEQHRMLGHQVSGFDMTVWERDRESIVYAGCLRKFAQNKQLRSLLLATAPTELVEANPHDMVWGVGLAESDPLIADRANWRGLNLLGVTLGKVRDALEIKEA